MTNKQFQIMVDEAKTVLKNYPFFRAFSAAQGSEIWEALSNKQRELVEQALMPHGETDITLLSDSEVEGSNPSGADQRQW